MEGSQRSSNWIDYAVIYKITFLNVISPFRQLQKISEDRDRIKGDNESPEKDTGIQSDV